MASELNLQPSKKKRKTIFDKDLYVFCSQKLSEADAVVPDMSKLSSLLEACRQRLDDVGRLILEHEQDIVSGALTFRYHRNCRATYCSKTHVQRAINKRRASLSLECGDGAESSACSGSSSACSDLLITRSRSGEAAFDWKGCCFVCGESCHPKRRSEWSMVESAVDCGAKETTFTRMLQAAHDKNDVAMIRRLNGVPNGDLVAIEARYHRKKNCLSTYINPRNVAAQKKSTKHSTQSIHDVALAKLIEEFTPKIEGKQVYLLNSLRNRYREFLETEGCVDPHLYTSQKLKERLMKEWPSLAFIPQKGSSDLVCLAHISVQEVLIKANELAKDLQCREEEEVEKDIREMGKSESEESIVHHACGILRKHIERTEKIKGEYYSPAEIGLEGQRKFVDSLLYKAIGWLIDDKLYKEADDVPADARYLSIACDITTLSTGIMSPKHLGLAVYLHHTFGSRSLIDLLYSVGSCISYTELRTFLTSAALHVDSKQLTNNAEVNAYIPPELVPIQSGGRMITGAADNWDYNEHTIDGKKTTHAMTSILLQPTSDTARDPKQRTQRATERSLDINKLKDGDLTKTNRYKKPASRPEPTFLTPISADEVKPLNNSTEVKEAKATELLYNMGRGGIFHESSDQFPVWASFQKALSVCEDNKLPVSQVAYNPIIMASSSDPSTIYTVMLRLKEAANSLGQRYLPLCFDMGLYTKASEIKWSRSKELENIILVEGGMHLLMSVISGIGYLYDDAGLSNLLVDSGVFASRTVDHMLSGKDFDRALYGLKLLEEALSAQFLQQFHSWCGRTGNRIPDRLSEGLTELESAFSGFEKVQELKQELCTLLIDQVLPMIDKYRKEGRSVSPTFLLWDEILFRVLLPVKVFISASRKGLWEVQQSAKAEFLPLLFASNRTNYARYLPVSLLQMRHMPQEIATEFAHTGGVVKLSEGHFNGVWLDYALETTQNKDLKGAGGIIGLTMRSQALVRWFIARPVTAMYAAEFKKGKETNLSDEKQPAQTKAKASDTRWNSDVKKIRDMLQGPCVDPFDISEAPTKLINIATGAVAPDAIEKSLCGALNKGTTMADMFVSNLASDNPKSFYAPIPRSNIKTMKEMNKKVKIKSKNVCIKGETMYLRLLAVNAVKRVPLQRVMAFENTPVPISIFNDDGTMVTCKKSDTMHKLEELIQGDKITSLDKHVDAVIYDGHAVIQSLPAPSTTLPITFKDMASRFLSHVTHSTQDISTDVAQIHIAFDIYRENSTKSQTREKRTEKSGKAYSTYEIRPSTNVPAGYWKQFLTIAENKSHLATLYIDYMKETKGNLTTANRSLFVSGGEDEDGIIITRSAVLPALDIISNQEEADTRLVLHACAAANTGAKVIVVCSPDTDVLLLLLHHWPTINTEVYFLTGKGGKYTTVTRYIPVHTLYNSLTKLQHSLLLPLYCITGCDTVSAFFDKGKKKGFNLMMKDAAQFEACATLGDNLTLQESQISSAVKFVCRLYGDTKCSSLNELRCQKAEKGVPVRKIPPTQDSFMLHLQRAMYQLYIWKHARIPIHNMPPATEYGYEKSEDGTLIPRMMTQQDAVPELLNLVVCECSEGSCSLNCSCFSLNQPCTSACACEAVVDGDDMCLNVLTKEAYTSPDSDTDD